MTARDVVRNLIRADRIMNSTSINAVEARDEVIKAIKIAKRVLEPDEYRILRLRCQDIPIGQIRKTLGIPKKILVKKMDEILDKLREQEHHVE